MKSVNLTSRYPGVYPNHPRPAIVEIPPMSFAAIDGVGSPDPDASPFAESVSALYQVSYAVRSLLIEGDPPLKYSVMPLEGRWPDSEDGRPTTSRNRNEWRWTLLIAQPDEITQSLFTEAVERAAAKKRNPAISRVELRELKQGTVAQVLHRGPYARESATIELLREFVAAQGLKIDGVHHEVYLSNPMRSAEESLRTLIRYGVTPTE